MKQAIIMVIILIIIFGLALYTQSFLNNTSDDLVSKLENLKKEIENGNKQEDLLEEKTDETISAAAQKTERYMERLSNEKIMAIQEYSDTVLGQINRNHEEAVFLYDMLSNKHAQVQNASAELDTVIRNMKSNIESAAQDTSKGSLEEKDTVLFATDAKEASRGSQEVSEEHIEENHITDKKDSHVESSDAGIQFESEDEKGNKKSRILKLHEEGKSNIEIAKNLGLGIGEVKLIIDLYESGE